MWSHHGRCACGRRTYLFAQCVHCARLEANERHHEAQARADKEEEVLEQDVLGEGPPPPVVAASTARKPPRVHWIAQSVILVVASMHWFSQSAGRAPGLRRKSAQV